MRKKLIVYEYQSALLYRDGKFVRILGPGRYTFWDLFGVQHAWVLFDTRPLAFNVQGQEILTKDKAPVRLTLAGAYRVIDPVRAQHAADNWMQRLYIDVQLALRDLVAGLTLEEVIDQKAAFGDRIRELAAPQATTYGIELQRVAVKDVTLPAGIRDLMLKVLEAEKSSQANLIKAREEVAAARARANAAKLLFESPGAMRLKELETILEVSRSPGNTIVFGAGVDLAGVRVG